MLDQQPSIVDSTITQLTALERSERGIVPYQYVQVPTATVILVAKEDPCLVLVGLSAKHHRPVLPGGKIEETDLDGISLDRAALRAAKRELGEEVSGVVPENLKFFMKRDSSGEDDRLVPAKVLRGSLVADCVASFEDEDLVLARYGSPDFIFIGEVSVGSVGRSAELLEVGFVDVRFMPENALSAGHGAAIKSYLAALQAHKSQSHKSDIVIPKNNVT